MFPVNVSRNPRTVFGSVDPCQFSSVNWTTAFGVVYVLYVCMYGHTYSKSMNQPGKVANPARDQLNRENEYFHVRVRA